MAGWVRLIIGGVLGCLMVQAANAEALKVGILDFPPYYVIDEGHPYQGELTDLLRKVLAEARYDYTINSFPPKRLYTNLGTGDSQVFIGIKGVREYDGRVLYSTEAIGAISLRIYCVGATPVLTRKEDLVGKSVVMIRGYDYSGLRHYIEDPHNNISSTDANDHGSGVQMLIRGWSPYLLDYGQPVESYLKRDGVEGVKYGILNEVPLYIIVSKATPDADGVMAKLVSAYHHLPID